MRFGCRYSSVLLLLIFTSLFASDSTAAQQKNSWDSAIDALAAKIGAIAGGHSSSVHLSVKNLSSLDASRVADFQQALEANLQRRGMKVVGGNAAEITVDATVSENLRVLIFAAEVRGGDSREVVLVSLNRDDAGVSTEARPVVRLEREVVWSQADPILDFLVLPAAADLASRLVVLEQRRVVIYRSVDGRWQAQESHPLPAVTAARDPRGGLTISTSDADASIAVDLQEAQCTLTTREKMELSCSTARSMRSNVKTDFVSLAFNCGGVSRALLTGNSDWTQTDSLRVVEVHDHANPVGEPMVFSGPILALWTGVESNTARVIWRDLVTGDYEAGIVTGSCGP
jgi:hypothetical protein